MVVAAGSPSPFPTLLAFKAEVIIVNQFKLYQEPQINQAKIKDNPV